MLFPSVEGPLFSVSAMAVITQIHDGFTTK
jgi:hypothetical protein